LLTGFHRISARKKSDPGSDRIIKQLRSKNERLVKDLALLRDQATLAQEQINQKDKETTQLQEEGQKLISTVERFRSLCRKKSSQ